MADDIPGLSSGKARRRVHSSRSPKAEAHETSRDSVSSTRSESDDTRSRQSSMSSDDGDPPTQRDSGKERTAHRRKRRSRGRTHGPPGLTGWKTGLTILMTVAFVGFGLTLLADMMTNDPQLENLSLVLHILSSVLLFAAIPLTHFSGSQHHRDWKVYQPFKGGPGFILLQALSWMFYSLAVLLSVATLSSWYGMFTKAFGLITSWGVMGLISQVFMVTSILTYESPKLLRRASKIGHAVQHGVEGFLSMNVGLAVCGVFLAVLSEAMVTRHPIFAIVSGVTAIAFFAISIFTTYGVGGRIVHRKWTFYQPFVGGAKFVLLQVFTWIMFAVSILMQFVFIVATYAFGFEVFVGITAVAGGACLLAEILMVLSLSFYKADSVERTRSWLSRSVGSMHALLLVTAFVNLQFIPFLVIWLPFVLLLPPVDALRCYFTTCISISSFIIASALLNHVRARSTTDTKKADWGWLQYLGLMLATNSAPILVGALLLDNLQARATLATSTMLYHIYIFTTFKGNPSETGIRRDVRIQEKSFIFDEICTYFGGRVIRTEPLDPSKTYVMGFHPHGVVPVTLIWLPFTRRWKELFPNLIISPLTASVLHYIPLLRDVLQKFGSREVTRDAIKHCLSQEQTVLLVPGGQAEMILSQSKSKQLKLYTSHKGFIRQALHNGAAVVPILSFGETETLDNIPASKCQRWFIRRFGLPVPHYPYGRLFLPIPRRTPITVVVGRPIDMKSKKDVTPEDIDEVHALYWAHIKELFEAHKADAGFPDLELVLVGH